MAISLFKKKPVTVAPPALAALEAHLSTDGGIMDRLTGISARLRTVNGDIARRDQMAADIDAQRAAIDTQQADARYGDQAAPDMREQKQALGELENRFAAANETARVAEVVKPRLLADIEALAKQRAELKPQTDRLLWAAVREEADSYLAEYLAARAAMVDIAHKLFAARLAADTIAKARAYGDFCGSGLYHDMYIPIPPHSSIHKPTAETARAAQVADSRLLESEAAELVATLLGAEG
jgi:hypothetical protein